MTYSEKLKDPRWQKKRLEILSRDNWTCINCRDSKKTLTVHHCRYSGEPWEIENNFLMTLCIDCHESRQSEEGDAKLMVAQISSMMDANEFHDFVGRLANVVSIKQSEKGIK